jgi:signal transduction histidine kinase
VQNQILAIQLNEKTTDSLGLSEIEQRVMEVIRDAEQTFRRLSGASLGEALEALRSDWEGYAVIKWEKLPENLSSSQERPIIALVQEAVTNAIRHGFAKMVEIRISQKNQQNVLYLEVLDDGTGPLGKRVRKGLGSRLLDELSNDNWSLEFRKSGGGRLVAEVIC